MKDLRSKRVLVTGGHGLLGSHVVDRLRRGGYASIAAPKRTEYDLIRRAAIEQLFDDCKPDVVIHAAAAVGGIGANMANPGLFFYANVIMGIELIEVARLREVEKMVVLGTICAYPKSPPMPLKEADLWEGYPDEVTAPYGIAKKALLVQCQTYRRQYGMNSIFLLPANLYGPRDHFDLQTSHVVPAMIRKFSEAARDGNPGVVLWGDGTATREFLYVEDAADGIIRATENYDKAEPVNLGTGVEVPIRELAERIARLTGYKGNIVWDSSQPNGQPRRWLDVSRADREFGFRATTSLEEGLRKTCRWYAETAGAVPTAEKQPVRL